MLTKLYKLEHCTYLCQYHIVWIPRYRNKVLADTYIKQELKRIFKFIAKWKGFEINAWHIGDEHIHLYLIVPPKYSIAYIIQILKSKSSNWLKKKTKRFPSGALWARGYFVSTLGYNEIAVKKYIENQSHHQVDLEQLQMFRRR
jgi:putative transposase